MNDRIPGKLFAVDEAITDVWDGTDKLLRLLQTLIPALGAMLDATHDLAKPGYWWKPKEGTLADESESEGAVKTFASDAWLMFLCLHHVKEQVGVLLERDVESIRRTLVQERAAGGHLVYGHEYLTAAEAAHELAHTVCWVPCHQFVDVFRACVSAVRPMDTAEEGELPKEQPAALARVMGLSRQELLEVHLREEFPAGTAFDVVEVLPLVAQKRFWRGVVAEASDAYRFVPPLVPALQREKHICEGARVPSGGRQSRKPRGRPENVFTRPRAEHAKHHVEGGGLGWEEATELYQAEHPDDTDVTPRRYKGAYERTYPPK